MSRGGTQKARAQQKERRRKQERAAKVAAAGEPKRKRKARARQGRGRAALIHLSGFPAPLALAYGLLQSGVASAGSDEYWLSSLVDDPNASYLSEPAGFLYLAVVVALTVLLFISAPVWVWQRAYRSHDVLVRDRTSVDGPFTMAVITAIVWVFRSIVGYTDSIAGFAVIMSILAVYVPIFSALLAVGMPVVPGSGRIGGILPGFLRMGFTERFLLTEEDRARLESFEEAKKVGEADSLVEASDDLRESNDPEKD